jgi:4-hydroxy-tetrahydrodipicolinate reductase
MTTRIGVNGAGGRMGRTVCRAVAGDADLELVAGVDPSAVGENVENITLAGDVGAFSDAGCDVVVDFTVAAAARTSVPRIVASGIHTVVGTTGLNDDDLAAFEAATAADGAGHVFVAANFSISAVLLMRLSELAAPFFDTAEIIELHHDNKADAPSGTALVTADRMAAASSTWAPDPTRTEVLPGARGGAGPAGIRVHSVRMRGMVAHQEVILGAQGQTLTIRQDSYDRESFMPGVVLACKRIGQLPGLTRGLDALLDL